MLNIESVETLIHELTRLPGIGRKSAERLAYHILREPKEYAERLGEAMIHLHESVHECPHCFNYTDKEICLYCSDPKRSDEVLCVVEEPSDIGRIESSGVFRGKYHVLHGVIAPLEGMTPEHLRIQQLLEKIEKGELGLSHRVREIILALDADLEGDTTILYLAKLLRGKNVKLTRIAHGVPIGSDIDYIDGRTMGRAIDNRVEL